MAALDTIADPQSGWSVTANKLKASIDRSRWAVGREPFASNQLVDYSFG